MAAAESIRRSQGSRRRLSRRGARHDNAIIQAEIRRLARIALREGVIDRLPSHFHPVASEPATSDQVAR